MGHSIDSGNFFGTFGAAIWAIFTIGGAVWSTSGSRGKGGGRYEEKEGGSRGDPRKSSFTIKIWNFPDPFTPKLEKPFAS